MSAATENIMDRLEKFFEKLNTGGMIGQSSCVWPVIVRRNFFGPKNYEYEYPYAFFDNMKSNYRIEIPYENRKERLPFVKLIIDKLMTGDIDIFSYHFGMYLVYNSEYRRSKAKEDFSEKTIGKKRAQFVQTLPVSRFMSTEDFISAIWSYQIKKWDTENNEYRYNPSMSNIRILFSSEQFSSWTGRHYTNADWVEPVPGASDLKCKTWTKEKDPMTQENTLPEGWVEGPIILGHEGPGNYRHFVQGVSVHAGSGIQVKFGDGWISGRYEWSFDGKSKIQVHSGDDVFYINEGHLVRVRK